MVLNETIYEIITGIIYGLSFIMLIVAICVSFVILCVAIGHLLGYKDESKYDNNAFYSGFLFILIVIICLVLLYLLGKSILLGW